MTTEGSVATNGPRAAIAYSNGTGSIELHLTISDPDLYAELSKRDEPERSEFAVASMKIGVIAFRQAQGPGRCQSDTGCRRACHHGYEQRP